tara:strand:+ start:209 stop:496 length:288 start_codon:yes stop_codon:yes gene_type:complete
MGLDYVELVMSIEEEFAIEIPDHEAENIATVNDVFEYLKSELEKQAPEPEIGIAAGKNSSEEIWVRLVKVICAQLNVDAKEVRPETKFVEDLGVD